MLDNDNPEHRADLVAQLRAKGLPAFEWSSGGDINHVVLPLRQEGDEGYEINAENGDLAPELHTILEHSQHNPHLFIATNSLLTSCEIGLMGEDVDGEFVASENWRHAADFESAVGLFEEFWQNGHEWLRKWVDGEIASSWGDDE